MNEISPKFNLGQLVLYEGQSYIVCGGPYKGISLNHYTYDIQDNKLNYSVTIYGVEEIELEV